MLYEHEQWEGQGLYEAGIDHGGGEMLELVKRAEAERDRWKELYCELVTAQAVTAWEVREARERKEHEAWRAEYDREVERKLRLIDERERQGE
jgi:hypothetical protein